MDYTSAFARYGAKLTNPQWSVSAFGDDGCLVLSLWQDLLKRTEIKGALLYRDRLSQWRGNAVGCDELKRHLTAAKESGARIRLVIAHPATMKDAEMVGSVADESQIKKTFSAREDLIGTLDSFDGDELRVLFRRAG